MSPVIRVMLQCERLDVAGGVERFVCTLANHLDAQGCVVSIATGSTRREQVCYPLRPAVRLLHGAPALHDAAVAVGGRLRRTAGLAGRQWRLGRVLARLARHEQPQVLVLNGLTTACSVLLAAPGLAARSICCDHNHADARSWPWRVLRRALYARAGAVVSLTEADHSRFAAINPRTEVIANASSLQADAPALPAEPLVLAVGRHVAQKGLDLLLQAWVRVVAALPEARLRIVGDGPLQAELQAQAAALGLGDTLQWCAPTPAIEAHYRAAAVFVLPSRYEGMPLALLEAQALGVPAVAFDCPTGPREIVGDEGGCVVLAGDTAALAEALLRLLRDPALRSRMARAAIARSRRQFSPAQHLQRWTALVQRVAARRVDAGGR